MQCDLDKLIGYDDSEFLLNNIRIKSKEYDFVLQEIENTKDLASKILCKLKEN